MTRFSIPATPSLAVSPATIPPQLRNGNFGGPINKKASFFFNLDRRNINELAAINAFVLDPNLAPVQMVESIPNPRQRTNLTPRLDWALSKDNTLTVRYQYYRDTETNNGIGLLVLPTQGYYSKETEDTLQISDTQVFGAKIVNETRFQYNRDNSVQTSLDSNPSVNTLGNFTGGGNDTGNLNDRQNSYEIQNYTSLIHGNHILKFGARVRATEDTNSSTNGFNSTFTFSSLNTATDTPSNCNALGQNPPCPISLLYAEQQRSSGGTPYATQLTYTTGLPTASGHQPRRRTLRAGRLEGAIKLHAEFWTAFRNAERHS